MGTTWRVKLAAAPGANLTSVYRGIEAVLSCVIDEMSPWEPNSHISRFNSAQPGTWHRLPDRFFKVLSTALHWAETTKGAYDPTIGALANLWGFGWSGARTFPCSKEQIESARAAGGWRRLKLDKTNSSAFQPGNMLLDLSSIAKGFAVDEVTGYLLANGIHNILVEIGGELRGEGVKPNGLPWWVELEKLREGHAMAQCPDTIIALAGLAVATSGDEQRFFESEGRRYAHTIDPATGVPVAHDLVSVTVAACDCMTADALATVLTVLGHDAGFKFAEERRIAARFVRVDGTRLLERFSTAMAEMRD
jgi:thiamine biosynthesis lipoprotein